MRSSLEVFLVFLKLGLTSFGGPTAHFGFFHDEFVLKKKWLEEKAYVDLVALCQILPGPASSQLGMAIGLSRSGVRGSLAAWVGFTLPSAILMLLFAWGVSFFEVQGQGAYLHGLKIVAVAVVAQAVWSLGRKLCPDKERATMAAVSAVVLLVFPSALAQILALGIGALAGLFFLRKSEGVGGSSVPLRVSKSFGATLLILFGILLGGLPFLASQLHSQALDLFSSYFRSGALVFGGGHVVLPLLQAEVVTRGWVSQDLFMAGYGAAQAIPGPLFSFAAYLGALTPLGAGASAWLGASLCLLAIFLPSFLLLVGVLPFWNALYGYKNLRPVLGGVNASVVGLLLAALYNPVWVSAISSSRDFGLAILCFLLLMYWKAPPWAVVVLGAVIGGLVL